MTYRPDGEPFTDTALNDPPEFPMNPGSDDAIRYGCTCPVFDNSHGHGYLLQPGIFWITDGCPLHAPHHDMREWQDEALQGGEG